MTSMYWALVTIISAGVILYVAWKILVRDMPDDYDYDEYEEEELRKFQEDLRKKYPSVYVIDGGKKND